MYISLYLSTGLSIYLSIHLSIYLYKLETEKARKGAIIPY